MSSEKTLYGTVFAIGIILGMVTLVTKSGIGIVVLTLLFIVMSCAEIYWWTKYQKAVYELNIYKDLQAAREAMDVAADNKKQKQLKQKQDDLICLCGHPQSEHGSTGVCLHVPKCKCGICKCTNFKPFEVNKS